MEKFQRHLKQKAHLSKIKNARTTIASTSSKGGTKTSFAKTSQQSKLLLSLYDNKSYDAIPAYKLLKTAGLQQYTRGFIMRGYGINLGKLALLTNLQKQNLFQQLKVLPGHAIKLENLIKILAKNSYGDTYSQLNGSEISGSSVRNLNSRSNIDPDIEYEKQLERVMNQYTPSESHKKTVYESKLSSIKIPTGTNKQPSRNTKPQIGPMAKNNQSNKPKIYDFQKKTSTQISIKRQSQQNTAKSTVKKKTANQTSSSGIKKATHLQKLLQNADSNTKIDSKKVMEINLEIDKVKALYNSFDGALMSSTIANIDLEQLIYAFAGYIFDIIIAAPLQLKQTKKMVESSQKQIEMQKNLSPQEIEDEVGQILRQSYLHPLYRNEVVQQLQQGEQVVSEGQNQEQQFYDQQDKKQNKMMQSSFLGGHSVQFGLSTPLLIFNEPQPTEIDYLKPTIDSIFNFIKNIVLAAKMQRQISLMAANYIEHFIKKSMIVLTSLNYKRILVSTLLLASKIWDDQSFQSPSFSRTFPQYSTVLLNEMQKQILKHLEYKLKLDKKQYATIYFKLRKYRKKNVKSYQNRKLDLNKIRELQNGIKKQYRSQLLVKRPSF